MRTRPSKPTGVGDTGLGMVPLRPILPSLDSLRDEWQLLCSSQSSVVVLLFVRVNINHGQPQTCMCQHGCVHSVTKQGRSKRKNDAAHTMVTNVHQASINVKAQAHSKSRDSNKKQKAQNRAKSKPKPKSTQNQTLDRSLSAQTLEEDRFDA